MLRQEQSLGARQMLRGVTPAAGNSQPQSRPHIQSPRTACFLSLHARASNQHISHCEANNPRLGHHHLSRVSIGIARRLCIPNTACTRAIRGNMASTDVAMEDMDIDFTMDGDEDPVIAQLNAQAAAINNVCLPNRALSRMISNVGLSAPKRMRPRP